MAKATCSVDGCDRPLSHRSWCKAHYQRWSRTGDAGSASLARPSKGGCSVPGCDKEHSAKGYCYTHARRLRVNGDPMVTQPRPSLPGALNPNWGGDDVEYQAVHKRLSRTQGPARHRDCVACGGRARDWAYMHTDPDEKISAKVGLPYSTDLSHYRPMCLSCHNTLDARHGWTRPDYFGRGTSRAMSGRWRAYYTKAGRQTHLGCYDTREEAAEVAHQARLALLTELEAASVEA